MEDPRFSVPPSTAKIFPPLGWRLAFLALGILAAITRLLTWPARRRRELARARNASQDTGREIFVLEPYGMGDVLALQPLVRAWCEAGRRVTVGSRAEWHALLAPHPNLRCIDVRAPWVQALDTPAARATRGRSTLRQIAGMLRPQVGGMEGVDVRGDVRSIILLYLAGCGRVRTLTHYYTANDCRVFPLAARCERVRRGVERWRLNAVFAEDEGLVLAPPSVAHLLGDVAESEPCRVGIVPLTPWAGKRWTPAHWREVIETLRQRGSRPVVLCGPGERGEAAQAVDRAQAPIEEMRHTADWAAALETCGGVITVNTGAMHIAASLDRPMVVIEASGRLPLWAPDSARARVLHRQDVAECAPCHQTGGNLEHARRCMDMITPDEVLEAFCEDQGVAPHLRRDTRKSQHVEC